MGGEDGPADVAVGGHGGQLPPGEDMVMLISFSIN